MINQQIEQFDVSQRTYIESLKIDFEKELLKFNFMEEFHFNVKNYVSFVMNRLYDLEISESFRKDNFVLNTTASDYLYKLISPMQNTYAVCGIFFRKGDLENAFVKIMLSSNMDYHNSFFPTLKKAAFEVFSKFKPKSLEIFSESKLNNINDNSAKIISLDRYILGSISDIVKKNQGKMISSLSLNISQNLNWYKNYTEIYTKNTHNLDDPSLNWPRAESEESIKECFMHGLLFDVQFMGDWIGIIAGKKDILYGSKVITIVEIIIDHDYRGTNLGKYIYILFARELAKRKDLYGHPLLFGKIFNKNKMALNAALSCERKDIGGSYLIF